MTETEKRSKSLKAAQYRYYKKNKDKYKINSYRSRAKAFITKYATREELMKLKALIEKELKKK